MFTPLSAVRNAGDDFDVTARPVQAAEATQDEGGGGHELRSLSDKAVSLHPCLAIRYVMPAAH